jgi:putative transposase
MFAALLRPLFTADGCEQARAPVGDALERLSRPLPRVPPAARGGRGGPARLPQLPGRPLAEAALDQPLERVNREIGRRTDVVAIFPN